MRADLAGLARATCGRLLGAAVTVSFAHASEAEMARILDFYAVRWEYEPHTFPILWNLEGEVVESFSPDFYLPDLDLLPRDDDAAPEARPQEEPQAAPPARAVPASTSSCSTPATSGR